MSNRDKFIDLDKYEIVEKLGSGAFAIVYKVRLKKDNSKYYAAKVSKNKVDMSIRSDETTFLFREVDLIASLNHPSILKFNGFSQLDFSKEAYPVIITEFVENESLRKVINSENAGLALQGWDATKKLINIYGIASGMMYLHKHNIVHRDLKPDNILIDKILCPKIADFGLSKIATTNPKEKSINESLQSKSLDCLIFQSQQNMKGTPIYMAPESIMENEYLPPSDVYSFSIIVFEIMTGQSPYPDITNMSQILQKIAVNGHRPELPFDVPQAYQELMEKCWSQKPEDRPTFEDIVNKLREDRSFITDLVDECEFQDYVEAIDEYHTTFNIVQFEAQLKSFQKVDIKNDLKINVKYIQTQIRSQMMNNLSSLILEVEILYSKFNHPHIPVVINCLKSFIRLIDTHQQSLPNYIPLKSGKIDVVNFLKLNEQKFERMSEKVKALINLMDHAGEENVTPLTEVMIQSVFCSLARRLLFVASEDAITSGDMTKKYPFILVDTSLSRLMYQVFLRVYFSHIRDLLVPLYVYISLGFVTDLSYMPNKETSLIRFNAKYPLGQNSENLNCVELYKNLLLMATEILSKKSGNVQPQFSYLLNLFKNDMMNKLH